MNVVTRAYQITDRVVEDTYEFMIAYQRSKNFDTPKLISEEEFEKVLDGTESYLLENGTDPSQVKDIRDALEKLPKAKNEDITYLEELEDSLDATN